MGYLEQLSKKDPRIGEVLASMNDYQLSKELDYLRSSYLFENKLQMKRLLSYLLEHANSSSESAYDQRAIAKECLGRGADFDPAENPVVRIEIGRLRKLLSRFYDEELPRPFNISIPMGQYRPEVIVESSIRKSKYLPELIPSPANPERLSVLLQFTTKGVDNTALYLLRHRIRIGITIALGRQEAVRLLVAIPGEDRKVADSIDFIMRVSLASVKTGFELSSLVFAVNSNKALFSNQKKLVADYDVAEVDQLLSVLVSELFDHEIGSLWPQWVAMRGDYLEVGALKVAALIQYQRYLFNESEDKAKLAYAAMRKALEYHPGDKITNLALADIYYRIVINDFNVVNQPIDDGLMHVREALRFSPGSDELHTFHAFLTMFQKEYDFAITSLLATENSMGAKYFSSSFHYQVFRCLMSEWTEGFAELNKLCDRFNAYPRLYGVMAYLNYFLRDEAKQTEQWKNVITQQNTQDTVRQCVKHMKLVGKWSGNNGRSKLLAWMDKDLGVFSD